MLTETRPPLYQQLLEEYRPNGRERKRDCPLSAHMGQSLDDPGSTMHEVDQAMEAGFGYYEKVRWGRKRPSPQRLLDMMRVLGFTPHDARACYLDFFGAEPILSAEPPSAHWNAVIAGQREMACVVTPDGRLRAWNEPFAELFADPGVPSYWWRWALSEHQADEVLLDWGTLGAPPLMAELKLLHLRHPDDLALRECMRGLSRIAVCSRPRKPTRDWMTWPVRCRTRRGGVGRPASWPHVRETIMTVLFETA